MSDGKGHQCFPCFDLSFCMTSQGWYEKHNIFSKLKLSVFYLSSSWEKCIAFSRCVFSGCGWGDYGTIFWISPGCGIPVFFTHSFDNDFIFSLQIDFNYLEWAGRKNSLYLCLIFSQLPFVLNNTHSALFSMLWHFY